MARVIEFGPGCDIPAARRRPNASEIRNLAYDAEVKAATAQFAKHAHADLFPVDSARGGANASALTPRRRY